VIWNCEANDECFFIKLARIKTVNPIVDGLEIRFVKEHEDGTKENVSFKLTAFEPNDIKNLHEMLSKFINSNK